MSSFLNKLVFSLVFIFSSKINWSTDYKINIHIASKYFFIIYDYIIMKKLSMRNESTVIYLYRIDVIILQLIAT